MRGFALFLGILLLFPCRVSATVELGIDVIERDHFRLFQGKRIGLVTNQTGVDSLGRTTREVLFHAPGVHLVKLYSPEHGIDGTALAGKYVKSQRDSVTHLPIYSLYGDTRKPTPEMLQGIDFLVFDLQDIGVRSYTYISTMIRCMEAAGQNNIPFVVLDRPNPLGGLRVEGPMIEPRWISFVGQVPVPYVHGLTAGEIARMTNDLHWEAAKCKLIIVPMTGWRRSMVWQETGLRWVKTSPNIPYPVSPIYYTVTGLVGSLCGVNIGIGTAQPFQQMSGPNFPAADVAARIRSFPFPGVHATPFYDNTTGWQSVALDIDPHANANLCALGLFFLAEANRQADLFRRSTPTALDLFYKVYGSTSVRQDLENGRPVRRIIASWAPGIDQFKQRRAHYLLYE